MLAVNREWFAKMVVSLTPVLARLTAGDLGPLLSPDHADVEDDLARLAASFNADISNPNSTDLMWRSRRMRLTLWFHVYAAASTMKMPAWS